MIETVREHLVMILHTSEGARVTKSCLWHGTPKVRTLLSTLLEDYYRCDNGSVSKVLHQLICLHDLIYFISYLLKRNSNYVVAQLPVDYSISFGFDGKFGE